VAEVLLDTDVFVDHLRGARRLEMGEDRGWYSVITRCELFSARDGRVRTVEDLLSPFGEIPSTGRSPCALGGSGARARTASLMPSSQRLRSSLTLMTRNLSDFQRVRGPRLR